MQLSYEEFVKMLEVLQSKMWVRYTSYSGENGKLNKSEVESILDTVTAYNMPIVLIGVGFGFGRLGVSICSNERFVGDKPEHLFTLSENHLDKKHFPWAGRASGGSPSNGAWDLFSKYTHSDSMHKRLDFSRLEKPRSRDRYEY